MFLARVHQSKLPGRNPRRISAAPGRRIPVQSSSFAPVVQARLRIGAPHDRFEQEADRVAEAAMRRSASASARVSGSAGSCCERETAGETKNGASSASDLLSAKGKPDGTRISAAAWEAVQGMQLGGAPLDPAARAEMESRFQQDFGSVRVHHDASAAVAAGALGARAFAFGEHIAFGEGEFQPDTTAGQRLMAHELTHVLQQRGQAGQSSPDAIRRQPKTDTKPPVFPDFPNLALKLEDDIGQNLFDYGHHFYQLATLFPDRPELLQQAFGRYALGKNVLDTGFRFLGLDATTASRLALGTGILFKGLNFVKDGEVVLDFQFDIGHGLKLETNLDLGVNPEDRTQVRKAEAGIGLLGRF